MLVDFLMAQRYALLGRYAIGKNVATDLYYPLDGPPL